MQSIPKIAAHSASLTRGISLEGSQSAAGGGRRGAEEQSRRRRGRRLESGRRRYGNALPPLNFKTQTV